MGFDPRMQNAQSFRYKMVLTELLYTTYEESKWTDHLQSGVSIVRHSKILSEPGLNTIIQGLT